MAFEIKGFGEPSKFILKTFQNFNNKPKKKVYIQRGSDGYQIEKWGKSFIIKILMD